MKQIGKGGKYFYPVTQLSATFRGKFLEGLKKEFDKRKLLSSNNTLIQNAWRTPWVVFCEPSFGKPEHVVGYLGRYTHKVAISNHRLLNVGTSGVTFRWRDYRDNKEKVMTLKGPEFLRRFCKHILPKGFVRIRHYGLLAASKREQLRELQQAFGIFVPIVKEKKNWKEICREHLNYNPDTCPYCDKGNMVTIETFLPGRSPPIKLFVTHKFVTKNESIQ